jgi:hypothetical protein
MKCVLPVSLILILFLPALAIADPPSVVGRLNLMDAGVSFRPGSMDEWAPAVLNYPLTAGDHLWTDSGSKAELHVGSTALRLDAGTEISFLNMDDQTVQVGVSQGQLNVRLRRLDPGDAFEIDTPNSVITLLQPGSYSLSVQSEEGSSLTVWNGQAEVTASGDDFTVPAGQVANVSGLGSIAYYLQPVSFPDGWDSWCASRDAREDRLGSLQYVSREMIGIEDLDGNGSWIVMAGYGPVWAPSSVAPGWAPYKFGRWAWVAPWGWTWIDDAPWGFAPFHYGRWAFVNFRWVWIPGAAVARPVYAPALVVFIGGGPGDPSAEGIGWFPLGPREVYVPPYGASTTYVQRINVTTVNNITVETIERIDVTQVTYVNRGVPSAVTVVPRQSFTQGRPAGGSAIVYSNDQIRRAPILGMGATMAPQRESIYGQPFIGRSPAPQPPPQVAGRSVFGRIVPAPAPAPFTFRPDPLPPATVYQRPPQFAPQPTGPVRQPAPIVINPMNRGPGPQAPPRGNPQPFAPQPMAPQPMAPQPQPFAPQPQPRPLAPQPGLRPQGPVPQGPGMQVPPQRQPAPGPQPLRPVNPQPMAPQPMAPQPMAPQPMAPQPGLRPQGPAPQGPVMQGPQPQRPLQPPVAPQQPPQQPKQPPVVQQPQQPPVVQPQQPPQQPQPQPVTPQAPQGPAPQGPGAQTPQGGDHGGGQSDNRGRGEAQSLINNLKLKTLPDVQRHLDSARSTPGAKLDYAALSRQIDAARNAIAAAESTLSTGKSDAALQQAQAVQKQLSDLDRQISAAALPSGGGGSDDKRPGDSPGQGHGDGQGNTQGNKR